ncbi:MAG TPA: DNA internalization-related competence protein ComEC/Rec2 [Thermodesulfovibrionales bacterium]|nr:DNA internalization-related competence protein ComEC/Rec2 [Thermodesulfovibrionales bacterium]
MHSFVSFLSGIALFFLFRYFPVIAVMLLLAAVALLLRRKKYAFIAVMIIGSLYAALRYVPPIDFAALSGRTVRLVCVVEDSPRVLTTGRNVQRTTPVSVSDAESGELLTDLKGREIYVISDKGLVSGSRYDLLAGMGRDYERHNPGYRGEQWLYAYLKEIGTVRGSERKGIYSWIRERRDCLNLYFRNDFDRDSGSFLASITTGERVDMSEEINDAFGTSGLAHLLSISGTHFGLFSMLVFGIFRLGISVMPYRLLQRFTIYLTPSQAAALLSLPFMLLYLLISDLSFPALRSFIMISLFLTGLLISRKGFWLNSVLFAAFLICLWDPSALLNLSFQLSFLAVLSIGFTAGERGDNESEGRGLRARVLDFLKGSLLVSLSASLGTAPLVAYSFHYFSLISPLANLFVTPFIGFVLVPLSLLSSFVFIFSGHFPFHSLIALASDLSLKAVRFFASVPFADIKIPAVPVIVIIIVYAVCMVYLSGRKRYALVFAVVTAAVLLMPGVWAGKGLSVTFLDVGQGDSAVLETPGGTMMVIDTGKTGREVDAYLKYRGKRTLDALIITHADDDHSAGAPRILRRFTVKEVWDNGLLIYGDNLLGNAHHRSLERGDEIRSGGLQIQVLHPYKGFYTFGSGEATAENNDSLVLKVTGEKSFLFTADTAGEAEDDMLHLRSVLKSDVLKVSHHGSRTSSSEDFLRMVSPGIAVISVGRYNTYGHPHKDVLERLKGVNVYRTDRDGAVKISETPEGLDVKTCREFEFERPGDLAGEWRNIKRLFAVW